MVDIKTRIKSIKDTGQITKAMQLISVAKLRKANDNYQKNYAYSHRVRGILKDILNHAESISHPYLWHRETNRTAYVVIASDNGLVGDYNHRVLSFADKIIADSKEPSIFTIGHMASEYFEKRGITPDVQFLYCAQNPNLEDARRITADLVDLYDNNIIDEVRIISTRMNGVINEAYEQRLLPILREDFVRDEVESEYSAIMDFEPSTKEVFDTLVPQYILGLTYSALIQAVRCEHSERIETMNNATKNADEMIGQLEQQFHRARQEQITTEIAELSSAKMMR